MITNWDKTYSILLERYSCVAEVDFGGETIKVLEMPRAQRAVSLVESVRPWVMQQGLCAQVATFYKGISSDEAVRLLLAREPLPDPPGDHIAVMKRAEQGDLIQIAVELGLKFSAGELEGLAGFLAILPFWSLTYVSGRLLGISFDLEAIPKEGRKGLVDDYIDYTKRFFPEDLLSRQSMTDTVKGGTLWIGEMGLEGTD